MTDQMYLLEWDGTNTKLTECKDSLTQPSKKNHIKVHKLPYTKLLLEKCISCIHNGSLTYPSQANIKDSKVLNYWQSKDYPVLCIWYGVKDHERTYLFACTVSPNGDKQDYYVKWLSYKQSYWMQLVLSNTGHTISIILGKAKGIKTVECKTFNTNDLNTIKITYTPYLFQMGYIGYVNQTDTEPFEGPLKNAVYLRKEAPPVKYEFYKIVEPRKHLTTFASITSNAQYTIFREQYESLFRQMRDGLLCLKRTYQFDNNLQGGYDEGTPCLNFAELEPCNEIDEEFVDKLLNDEPIQDNPPPPPATPPPPVNVAVVNLAAADILSQ